MPLHIIISLRKDLPWHYMYLTLTAECILKAAVPGFTNARRSTLALCLNSPLRHWSRAGWIYDYYISIWNTCSQIPFFLHRMPKQLLVPYFIDNNNIIISTSIFQIVLIKFYSKIVGSIYLLVPSSNYFFYKYRRSSSNYYYYSETLLLPTSGLTVQSGYMWKFLSRGSWTPSLEQTRYIVQCFHCNRLELQFQFLFLEMWTPLSWLKKN